MALCCEFKRKLPFSGEDWRLFGSPFTGVAGRCTQRRVQSKKSCERTVGVVGLVKAFKRTMTQPEKFVSIYEKRGMPWL